MSNYQDLKTKCEELSDLAGAISVMMWDQEVMMPAGGGAIRARQISTLSGWHHHKLIEETGPIILRAWEEKDKLPELERRNVELMHRMYSKATKLPNELVRESSQLTSMAVQTWAKAKKADDFSIFQPLLEQVVDLKLRMVDYLGYEENPYDALIDEFEPDMTARRLDEVFGALKPELKTLLDALRNAPQVEDDFLRVNIPQEQQLAFSQSVVAQLGYDLSHGRQDLSAHPFTIGIHPTDVRITTMVQEDDFREMLYSSIHEGGHALYEQGLPTEYYGLPASDSCSLSIHESQSRLWENNVGRSQLFWEHFAPALRSLNPEKLGHLGASDIFRGVNKVEPSLIRISADELTYHYHVMIRYELELALINRELKVADLPAAWNEKVRSYLGLEVPSDAKGVLQDIHWSHGSIGYFPTYSLGSLYAAQLMAQARKSLPDLDAQIARGDFSQLLGWLRTHIHRHGKLHNSETLCTMATGEGLNVSYFVEYARAKYSRVYGIDL